MDKQIFVLFLALSVVPVIAEAQSMQEQIQSVDSVMTHQAAVEAEAQAKEQRRMEVERQRMEAQATAQRIEHEKEQRIRNAQLAAQQAVRDQAKLRDQARIDKARDLQLEEMSLDLETKRARAKRADDFVDQELKEKAATTDVVQSEADSNRNVSSGIGENLKSTGHAEETKAGKWF